MSSTRIALTLALSLGLASSARAAEVLDAHDASSDAAVIGQIFGPGFFNRASAQTFTAEHTGTVGRMVVAAGWFRSPPSGLTASLAQLDAAGSPGAVIASVSVAQPVTGLSEFMAGPVTFDFTGSGAGVAAGGRYALVLTGDTCCAGVPLLPASAYAGGSAFAQSDTGAWSETSDSDLLFQVYVNELVSAPPPKSGPSTKDDCKGNGWKAFPTFKNQGQCVASTNR